MTYKFAPIDISNFMANIERCNCDKIHMVAPPFMHAVIGIADESGELIEMLKRALYYGDPISTEHILEEYGDLLFFILLDCRRIAKNREMSVEEVFQEVLNRNIAKLEQRYKKRFTEKEATETSRNRARERKAMNTAPLESLSYRDEAEEDKE